MKKMAFLILVAMIFASFAACSAVPVSAAGDETKIAVTEALKVTSAVQNIWQQTYKSTITGRIKNQTSEELTNIVITVNVKTNTLGNTGTLVLTITKIAANATHTINTVTDTEENFETVVSLSATINGGAPFTLSNTPTIVSSPNNNGDGGNDWIYGVLGAIIIIAIPTVIVIYFVSKKKRERMMQQAAAAKRAQQAAPQVIVVSAPSQPAAPQKKFVKCEFCGTVNDDTDLKCQNCGSALKR